MYRELIRERYEHLSKSQKRIADYLMMSPREAAFMTASRLAVLLNVDIATITRFAQRLTYRGYPELLTDIRSTVQREMREGFTPVEGISDAGRAFVHALAIERENVERTMSAISIEAVEKALAAMEQADTIYIAGQNTAVFLAEELAVRLRMMGMRVVVVHGDLITTAVWLVGLHQGDVAVGIGFSSYATDVAGVLRAAHQHGATTIGISGSDVSPVARVADIVLICSAASPLHIPTESSVMAVIEGLAQGISVTRRDTLTANMHAFSVLHDVLSSARRNPVGSAEESLMKMY